MQSATHPFTRPSGFALVATISMMVILTVVAVGLLSLSTIALRSSAAGSAEERAQANARMALMMALDRLQAEMGPDQRISASASILSSSSVPHPHWVGVWNSWEAGGESGSSHSTIEDASSGMHPTYEPRREDHFRSWLVSLDLDNQKAIDSAVTMNFNASRKPTSESDAVILVGEGSLSPGAPATEFVHAPLVQLRSKTSPSSVIGRYGWWVSDESQKASIMNDSYEADENMTMADHMFRHQAPASTGTSSIEGLENIVDDQQLAYLPSRNTLNVVDGVEDAANRKFHHLTTQSNGVLSDVREGGLKRDLSTILERNIDPDEVYTRVNHREFKRVTGMTEEGDDFMLYRFDNLVPGFQGVGMGNPGEANVPIQDLAAYYQLYNHNRSGWRGGVQYSSNMLGNGIQVQIPDYGQFHGQNDMFLREYTTMYRNPVPVKMQLILNYVTVERTPGEIASDPATTDGDPSTLPDTHKLKIGLTPAITFWNPNNVPLVMNNSNPQKLANMLRLSPMPFQMEFIKNEGQADEERSGEKNIGHFVSSAGKQGGEICTMWVSGTTPVRFKPGEFKVFSFAYTSSRSQGDYTFNFAKGGDNYKPEHEGIPGWDPTKFLVADKAADFLTFKSGDRISTHIISSPKSRPNKSMHFSMIQKSRQSYSSNDPTAWHYRQYSMNSRETRGWTGGPFAHQLILRGMPARVDRLRIPARSANNLIADMGDPDDLTDDLPQPFAYFGIKAGVETSESVNAGIAGGRKFASRPFTHSSPLSPPFIDNHDDNSLYNYGWNWWIDRINSVFEAPVEISINNEGYHGGGYTPETGTTHAIQQHLPLTPPISIASMSHAHLSGYSLSEEPPCENWTSMGHNPTAYDSNERVTAHGYAGLAPHILQAIGNSYAHPLIPADKVLDSWTRSYWQSSHRGPEEKVMPFADHSYLANKALWDDYYFSSITPQPSDIPVFEQTEDLDTLEVARRFFFDQHPLPNRRIQPYTKGFDEDSLEKLHLSYDQFRDGFADQIAAHLMVEGAFNINSTSAEAWISLLSSLKGKRVAYLNSDSSLSGNIRLDEAPAKGTPIGGGNLPNGPPYDGSPNDPSDQNQWSDWRELTDQEIEELATAIVKQVKLRGPFLSLSEFVNRRLDSSNPELSVKGALQAALDDPDVSINAGFRNPSRQFSNDEISAMNPKFPLAMQGAIAYGSAAYVDQADILRNFGSQLTPRGDTFVIRAYGDALDANGKVLARAWCEATIQRVPEYISIMDAAHAKHEDLSSSANKTFGRKMQTISFRWLNASEI